MTDNSPFAPDAEAKIDGHRPVADAIYEHGLKKARPRRVVAFVSIESPEMRVFNAAATGNPDRPRRIRTGMYWCGADKPDHDHIAPVYDGTEVPADACCEECGIPIREVQAMVSEIGDGISR